MRWRDLALSPSLALLVDLDGTLIEFAPTLEEAALPDGVISLLERVAASGVHVVVVSGRPRTAVDPLRARIPAAWWVAEHGGWRWANDTCVRAAPQAQDLDTLAARLGPLLTAAGVRVERKTCSLCVHWRGVERGIRDELIAALEAACDEWLEEHPSFERLTGVQMLEVRDHTVHKGTAVAWVREHRPDARILAIGDDITDEDMFGELEDRDGSIGVGDGILADARVSNVGGVLAFLQWLVDYRHGSDTSPPIEMATNAPLRRRHRLLVMSNRTPATTQGRTREVGGLVSALEPALRDEDGIWLGWSGQVREHDSRIVIDSSEQPHRARFDLPAHVRQQYYAGFCNRALWPLFHGFSTRVHCTDADWAAYVVANTRFAQHAFELAQRHATIWVHDYHLLLTASALRRYGHRGPIGLFLHIPFPAPDQLSTLPWARLLVEAMHDFDLIGFQTDADAAHFRQAGQVFCRDRRVPQTTVLPATIDPEVFHTQHPEVREVAGLRTALGERRLILGVDRLDYSKGIPQRLDAYERLLDHCPEWRRRVSFLQISVPSRAEIPDYAELREHVERIVGRINGRFGDTDWVPVRYLYRSYDRDVLAQLYRLADVALVTPLRDGMNLVAKEFIASQDPARPGVLVLSRYAGAAHSLTSAVLTNPLHPEGLAADIDVALRMPAAERLRRHRLLMATLEREGNAKQWARRFLDELTLRAGEQGAPAEARSVSS